MIGDEQREVKNEALLHLLKSIILIIEKSNVEVVIIH
jgi:hypothetical protein